MTCQTFLLRERESGGELGQLPMMLGGPRLWKASGQRFETVAYGLKGQCGAQIDSQSLLVHAARPTANDVRQKMHSVKRTNKIETAELALPSGVVGQNYSR